MNTCVPFLRQRLSKYKTYIHTYQFQKRALVMMLLCCYDKTTKRLGINTVSFHVSGTKGLLYAASILQNIVYD